MEWPAPASHSELLLLFGVGLFVVLGGVCIAALVPLMGRPRRFGDRSELPWRHHLGCSIADTATTSATIVIASDQCLSFSRDPALVNEPGVPAAGIVPGAADELAEEFAGSVAASTAQALDDARLEILRLERLWELSPESVDDVPSGIAISARRRSRLPHDWAGSRGRRQHRGVPRQRSPRMRRRD